jgi:hypothetical protein
VQKGNIVELTDKELLVLAAMAACIEGQWNRFGAIQEEGSVTYEGIFQNDGKCWNPLENDGDALRLAVKLNLTTGTFDSLGYASASYVTHAGREVYVEESIDSDPYTATRRAIVRVAAEIGSTSQDTRQPSINADKPNEQKE